MASSGYLSRAQGAVRILHAAARGTAAVTAVFCLVIVVILAMSLAQARKADPIDSPVLEKLIREMADRPDDEDLKYQIRSLDLLTRRAHFATRAFIRNGAFLLLGGVVLLLASLRVLSVLERRLPEPAAADAAEPPHLFSERGRRAMSIAGGAALAASVVLGILFGSRTVPPASVSRPPSPRPDGGDVPLFPSREEMLRNWPGFRGPDGNGIAYCTRAPLKWNGATGKGVLWKTEVPRPGFSSPVVWGGRVFLSGADRDGREIFCFDADTGDLLWRASASGIPGSPAALPEVMDDTGHAAPTMATDGRRAYAMFSTGDLMAVGLDGKKVWGRNLGVPRNGYGHSSSPIVFRDTLLVQYDHAGGARLLILDARTGETRQETVREVETSWSSPIIVETESGPLAVLCADPTVAGYDPETGLELWAVKCLEGAEVGPSAAYANGLVFAANDNAKCAAIDLETEKILWDRLEELPDCASPLAVGAFLFLASSAGEITCLEARTGKVLWQREFDDGFYASPIAAGDRVYLTDRNGVTHVFRAGAKYEEVAANPLGEKSDCTPAIVTGRIFLRGRKHLYCVGEK